MSPSDQASGRIGAIAGLAFALLLFVSIASFNPLRGATDQELQASWTDGSLRRDSIVSMYLMLLAGPCFLVFLAHLRARLRTVDPQSVLVDLVYGAGLVFVAMLSITALSRALIAHAIRFGDEPLPGPDTLRYATEFSSAAYGLVTIPFATFVVAAASIMIQRTSAMSRWVGWLGMGVTALSVILIVLQMGALATPLILLWVLGVSVQLFRTRGTQVVTAGALQAVGLSQPQGMMSQQ